MAIIISQNGKSAKRLNQSTIDKDDYLQQYIYDNPDAVPVYEIDNDIRLLILAREFYTDSGPIDALGIDQNGNIYLIETKLYKNTDKRTVVAQVLDYGASLWRSSIDFNDFTAQLDKHVLKQFGKTLTEKIQEFYGLETDPTTAVLDTMRANLNGGTFKFVVLMDSLERRLKDLILFVNSNSQFDVYAVELEFYKHDQFEIIIPKLYGAEVKKEVSGTRTTQPSLTLEAFWQALASTVSVDQLTVVKPFIEYLVERTAQTKLGTASIGLVYEQTGDKALCTMYKNGYMTLNFGNLPPEQKLQVQSLCQEDIPAVWSQAKFQKERILDSFPSLTIDEIAGNVKGLQRVFDGVLNG